MSPDTFCFFLIKRDQATEITNRKKDDIQSLDVGQESIDISFSYRYIIIIDCNI